MQTFKKDPDAVLDYKIDWSSWLGTDTISTSIWFAGDAGITIDSDQKNDTETVVWLSDGQLGIEHTITNRITTVAGRTDDRSIIVLIEDK